MEIIYRSLEKKYSSTLLKPEDVEELITICNKNFKNYRILVDDSLFDNYNHNIVDLPISRYEIPLINLKDYKYIKDIHELITLLKKKKNVYKFILQIIEDDKIVFSLKSGKDSSSFTKIIINSLTSITKLNKTFLNQFGYLSTYLYISDRSNIKYQGLYHKIKQILKKRNISIVKKRSSIILLIYFAYYSLLLLYLSFNSYKMSYISLVSPIYLLLSILAIHFIENQLSFFVKHLKNPLEDDIFLKKDMEKQYRIQKNELSTPSCEIKSYRGIKLYKDDIIKLIKLIQTFKSFNIYLDNYKLENSDELEEINKKRTEYMKLTVNKNDSNIILDIFKYSSTLFIKNSFDLPSLALFYKIDEILTNNENKYLKYLFIIYDNFVYITVFLIFYAVLILFKFKTSPPMIQLLVIISIYLVIITYFIPLKSLSKNYIYLEDYRANMGFLEKNREYILTGAITAIIGGILTVILTYLLNTFL